MADNIYMTPRALAEDILLIAKGGGFLTDDNNPDQRQVLYWIADYAAAKVREAVEKSLGNTERIDNRLWVPLCLSMSEAKPPRAPMNRMPQLFCKACVPAQVMALGGTTLIRDVFWGDRELAKLPIGTVRQGSAAYSRFGIQQYGWAVAGPTLYACLPVTEDANQTLTALAVLSLDNEQIIDSPDEPISWLPEWNVELRSSCLQLMGIEQNGAPDLINNAADLKTDKR